MDEFSALDQDYLDEGSQKNIEDYICCICQLIPNYHSALEEVNCGHLFCFDCLTEWLKKSNKCPFCKENIITRNIEHENKIVYRFLINLIVKCQKDNCSWKGQWNELKEHFQKEHIQNINNVNEGIVFNIGELYKTKIHPDKLQFIGKSAFPWKCDCICFGNCLSEIYDPEQSVYSNRFSCPTCNFNLCEKCMRYYYESNVDNKKELFNFSNNAIKSNINQNGQKKESIYTLNQFYLCKVHKHLIKYLGITDSKWYCNGKNLEDNCYSGITNLGQNRNIPRFRCEKCDFDLCLNCMNHYIIKGKKYNLNEYYKSTMHEHPLIYIGVTNVSWCCDIKGIKKNCLSGIKSYTKSKIPRFRCYKCDFDICINCFDYYSNVEKDNCFIF